MQPRLWEDEARPVAVQPAAVRGLPGLRLIDWSFAESRERGLTHGLHPWAAKFIPDIPATAIALLTEPGDVVLDPFTGCGTTAVEAVRAGRGFVAADVNPLAVRITEGKCEAPSAPMRRAIREWCRQLTVQRPSEELLRLAPPIPNLREWFDEEVVAQLAYILREIRALGAATAFLETVFSAIIVGVSHQESETRYRRIARQVSAAETLAKFRRRLLLGLDMAAELDAAQGPRHARTYLPVDARALDQHLRAGCAHLAVFSPPYPNAFDYHLYHRFRMFWLGMDPRAVKSEEIGAHLRYQPDSSGWLEDMGAAFRAIRRCLAPGAFLLCVVGDGVIKGRPVASGDLLWEAAQAWGLVPEWRVVRAVAKHRKAFNLADARLAQEQVLVFKR